MNTKVKENGRISTFQAYCWALTTLSGTMTYIVLAYLTFYLTNSIFMSATTVGTILLLGRVLDGISDLIAGWIIEKTNSKMGKARPYTLSGIVGWIFIIVLFAVPTSMSQMGQIIYVFTCYTLIQSVFMTLFSSSEGIFMARATTHEDDRIKITVAVNVLYFVTAIMQIALPVVIAKIGTDSQKWTLMVAVIAVVCMIMCSLRFIFIKEIDNKEQLVEKKENLSMKTMLNQFIHNKYGILIVALNFLVRVSLELPAAVIAYYYLYIFGDIGLASFGSISGFIIPFVSLALQPLLNKYGKVKIAEWGIIIAAVTCILKTIFRSVLPVYIGASMVGSLAGLPLSMVLTLFLCDSMDYGQWNSGIRTEGVYSSFFGCGSKIASGIAAGLSVIFLGMAGFNATLPEQPASAINCIYIIANVIPLVLNIVIYFVCHRFKALEEKMPEIRADIASGKCKTEM